MHKFITVKGARVNNLKNIDVAIPRDKLVVMTGLSALTPGCSWGRWTSPTWTTSRA